MDLLGAWEVVAESEEVVVAEETEVEAEGVVGK